MATTFNQPKQPVGDGIGMQAVEPAVENGARRGEPSVEDQITEIAVIRDKDVVADIGAA